MKRELEEQLCIKFPGLYHCSQAEPMDFAFACGDGWYTLIDVISELLTKHSDLISAEQVKEKLGTLRFYHSGVDSYSMGVEISAGQLSSLICEVCGASAKTKSDDGWLSTLCEKHNENYCSDVHASPDLSQVAHLNFGKVWSEMIAILLELCAWSTEKNDMPKAVLNIEKVNDKLAINIFGGDEFTKGMVDLFVTYANRIDEHSGLPTSL